VGLCCIFSFYDVVKSRLVDYCRAGATFAAGGKTSKHHAVVTLLNVQQLLTGQQFLGPRKSTCHGTVTFGAGGKFHGAVKLRCTPHSPGPTPMSVPNRYTLLLKVQWRAV
jgi:hypothetical protein